LIVYFGCFAGNATKITPANSASFSLVNGKDDQHKNLTITDGSGTNYSINNLSTTTPSQNNNLI
jgi:hypothetical protein